MMKAALIYSLCAATSASATYVWPSKYDSIDDMYYLSSGYISDGTLSDLILNCGFGANQPGVQKTAQWLRTPFHDMITYDAAAKTGGLDASLQFELGRFENFGLALNQTFGDISSPYNLHTSASDLLALAMVMAVERCGGLSIPLRLGRVDATHAGPPGVPLPDTNQTEMRRIFTKAGFSQEDTIEIVACGHSIGGAHRDEGPHVVPTGPNDHSNRITFDTTPDHFDNVVVLQYLNDTTKNPLVKSPYDSFNSDKRIYMSDGNVTMHKLADESYYQKSCSSILGRMIDTVPAGVVLTDPITPTDIKPYITSYARVGNETHLTGRIRIRTGPTSGRDVNDMTVTLLPKGPKNETLERIPTDVPSFNDGKSYGPGGEIFTWFEFSQNLSASAARSFDIEIHSKSRGSTTLYDNAGTGGYPLNANILWQDASSCTVYDSDTETGTLQVVAAIRKTTLQQQSANPEMIITRRDDNPESVLPKLSTQTTRMSSTGRESGEFEYWVANVTLPGGQVFATQFDLRVENEKVEWIDTLPLGSNSCEMPV